MGRDGGLEPLGVAWTGVGEIAEGGDVGPGGIRVSGTPEDLDELQAKIELPGILRQFRLDEGAGGDHKIPLEEEVGEVEDVFRFGLLGLEPAHHLPDGTRLPGRDADLSEFAGDIEPGRMIAHITLEVGRGGIEPLDPAEVALQFEDAGRSFGGLEAGDDGFEILLGGGIATEGILDFDEPETQVEARGIGLQPIREKAEEVLEIRRALEPLEGPRLDQAGLREPVQGGRQHRDRLVATLHRNEGFGIVEHGDFALGIRLQGLLQRRDKGSPLLRRRDRLKSQAENLPPTPVSGSQLREETVE